MSRADRREQEREYIKFNKKFNKLNGPQKELANKIGREMANIYIKKLLDGLDRSVSAAAILLGADIKKAYEVSFLVGKLLGEDTRKVQEFEEQFIKEEDCKMAMKKIDKEVKSEIEKLISEGVSKKGAIEKLVFKFPRLSKSMLTNAYQSVKEEIQEQNKEEEDPEVEAAVKYIFQEEKEVKKEDKEVETKEVESIPANNTPITESVTTEIEHIAEDSKMIEEAGETVEMMVDTSEGLEVLEEIKIFKVKGNNGEYEADSRKGVILSREDRSIYFENEEQLDEWVNEFKRVFGMIK